MHMVRPFYVSMAGSVVLAASVFLPWLRIGSVPLAGVSDPAGFFVLGLGVFGVLLSAAGIFMRRNMRQGLMLVGLAGLTTLAVIWRTGPSTIADRAQARAEAVALVDKVAVQPPPRVAIGPGLLVGLAASAVVASVGLAGAWKPARPER